MEQSSKGKALQPKPNNIMVVPASFEDDFFKWWCVFLRPFIKLTDKEIEVVASFLRQRQRLSKSISDPTLLDQIMMSEETKTKVREECNITQQNLYVIMRNLRKSNVFTYKEINPKLIPNIRVTDNGVFQLLILFKDNKK